MSPTHEVAYIDMFPGLARWARVVDDLFHDRAATSTALAMLPVAYAHVQAASPLGRWMYEVSRGLDSALSYDVSDMCRLSEGLVAASSPFGVWMREVSAKLVG